MDYNRGDMAHVFFSIKFNGKEVTEDFKRNVTNIDVEEGDYESDLARITVMDDGFKFSNNSKILQDMKAEVSIGFKGKYKRLISGTVTHVEADFGDNGAPTLIIGITDDTNIMSKTKKTRKWTKKRASDIVSQIAKEHGLTPVVDVTKTIYDEISQDDETDLDMLSALADQEGYQYYIVVAQKKLFFGERIRNPQNDGVLYYKMGDTDILNFKPQLVTKDSPNDFDWTEAQISSSTAQSFRTTVKATVDTSSKQDEIQDSLGAPYIGERR